MLSRPALFLCSLLFVVFQQQCNPLSPDSIKAKAETELHPYFPRAVVIPLPEKESIVALTCTQGDGPELLHALKDHMAQDRSMNDKLVLAQTVLHVAGARYRYLLLYFDTGVIRYDLSAREISVKYEVPPNDLESYNRHCGF